MKRNKKAFIIVFLCILAVGMGIGYSILQQQLKIEGNVTVDPEFEVQITGIEMLDDVSEVTMGYGAGPSHRIGTVTEVEKPTFTATTATFNVRLGLDTSVYYLINVENKGTMAAQFDPAQITQTGSNDIVVETPVDIDKLVLEGGASFKYIVKLSYNYSTDLSEETASSVSITLNAKQLYDDNDYRDKKPYILLPRIYSGVPSYIPITVINLVNSAETYGETTLLYMSVDDGEYERLSYSTHVEGASYFTRYYNTNDVRVELGEDLLSQTGSHTIKFKLLCNGVESNEVSYSYYIAE